MEHKKILILGGNRFVGKLLAEKLLNHHHVTLFNRKGTGPGNCKIIKGDRNNIEDLKKLNFHEYDCIVDMCLYLPSQFKLMEPLLNKKVNYIFISSGAAYKDVDTFPIY